MTTGRPAGHTTVQDMCARGHVVATWSPPDFGESSGLCAVCINEDFRAGLLPMTVALSPHVLFDRYSAHTKRAATSEDAA